MKDQINWDSLIEFLIAFFGTKEMIDSLTVSKNSYQEKMLTKAIAYKLVVEVSRHSSNSVEVFSDYILLPKGKKEIEKYKNQL